MNATIITASRSTKISVGDTEKIKELKEESEYISGSNAGICYANDSYFDEKVSGRERAIKRCNTVLGTNHHSISNHAEVEVLFEGISKSMAMILNNLTFYATSEKSGRYTKMTGVSPIESKYYEKWIDKLKPLIQSAYPNMDEKLATKLAMENARLFLSANSPIVTMGYSTALNQWSYITYWLDEYANFLDHAFDEKRQVPEGLDSHLGVSFAQVLSTEMRTVVTFLTNLGLNSDNLHDPKRRHLRTFFESNIYPPKSNLIGENRHRGLTHRCDEVIISRFQGSFAMVAQMQRHRTLKLRFALRKENSSGFMKVYCPDIVIANNLKSEWISDMNELFKVGIIPIGTLLDVKMIGTEEDYDMMFSERLCGRAQLEIMKLSFALANEVHIPWDVKTKCQMNGGCKEPCMFIKDGLKNKKV